MKKRGNINIKLTNILKQTQECCNKKKCPKGSKKCKSIIKKKKRKKDEVGIFGGMPNIIPTSRAIPMPQSVVNNITPVPNIPMPRQLPAYSQFRRPPSMYQRNDRPLQVQQGRGVRQPQRQPLMVSTGIQTARRQAIAVQTGIRGQGIVATQAPKKLKFNPPPQPLPIPILNQAPPKRIFTQTPPPRPIPILNQAPPPRLTKTRGVISDNQIRGSQGTSDMPFNAPVPTPNILDRDSIMMRNEEQDRRDVARTLTEMARQRVQETIQNIGKGTPREDPEEPPEVIIFSDTDTEEEVLDQQIQSVEKLVDEAENQGKKGFVEDQIDKLEQSAQIDDEPPSRRGRLSKEQLREFNRRRQNLIKQGVSNIPKVKRDVLDMDSSDFDFSSGDEEGVESGAGTLFV